MLQYLVNSILIYIFKRCMCACLYCSTHCGSIGAGIGTTGLGTAGLGTAGLGIWRPGTGAGGPQGAKEFRPHSHSHVSTFNSKHPKFLCLLHSQPQVKVFCTLLDGQVIGKHSQLHVVGFCLCPIGQVFGAHSH